MGKIIGNICQIFCYLFCITKDAITEAEEI